ncbi:MAG TPA: DUF4342 domain-containing protein [Vicinamibacterales bacterium]|nr:DUF4342 domain-containing protein [Vicinamibacterales bacterium]
MNGSSSGQSRPGETFWESVRLEGGQLVGKIADILHEGNVRRVIIKQDERVLMEFPLSVGVVGVMLAPILAAVGAAAVMIKNCTIDVEREARPRDGEGAAANDQ